MGEGNSTSEEGEVGGMEEGREGLDRKREQGGRVQMRARGEREDRGGWARTEEGGPEVRARP